MITVTIDDVEKLYNEVTPKWINEQIVQRRRDGVSVCVQVAIKKDNVDMRLSTPGCASACVAPRQARKQEQEILDLWEKLHLSEDGFTGGHLIAFLKQIRGLA